MKKSYYGSERAGMKLAGLDNSTHLPPPRGATVNPGQKQMLRAL